MKKLSYREEVASQSPYECKDKQFIIYLMDGNTEVGIISGRMYDSFHFYQYKDVLEYADEMSLDEYIIVNAMIKTLEVSEDDDISNSFATIDKLYVLPEYRGRGYAREAMSEIYELLSNMFGIDCMVGLIAHAFETEERVLSDIPNGYVEYLDDETSTDRLVEFYESVGFEVAEELYEEGNARVMVLG